MQGSNNGFSHDLTMRLRNRGIQWFIYLTLEGGEKNSSPFNLLCLMKATVTAGIYGLSGTQTLRRVFC